MGHDTEHHREQNPGTGYHKEHKSGASHDKGCCSGSDHHKRLGPAAGHSIEQPPDAEQCNRHGQENDNEALPEDNLVAENIAVISETVMALHATMDHLVQKTASMACLIIAMEEILTEIITENGLSLAPVNARIRARIATGTNNEGSSDQAIDAAASIASILPHH